MLTSLSIIGALGLKGLKEILTSQDGKTIVQLAGGGRISFLNSSVFSVCVSSTVPGCSHSVSVCVGVGGGGMGVS